MGSYLKEYDETDPISIETYAKKLVGKLLQMYVGKMILQNQQLLEKLQIMK